MALSIWNKLHCQENVPWFLMQWKQLWIDVIILWHKLDNDHDVHVGIFYATYNYIVMIDDHEDADSKI